VWLIIGTKRQVHHWVRNCTFDLNGMRTVVHLNVLLLGVYNMLLGIYWLYLHRTVFDFYYKAIECGDDNGKPRVLQGKKKSTSVRMVKTI